MARNRAFLKRSALCAATGFGATTSLSWKNNNDADEDSSTSPWPMKKASLLSSTIRPSFTHLSCMMMKGSVTNCQAAALVPTRGNDESDSNRIRIMSREPRLQNKVAVITGASRGIGQAIAIKFVQEGCKVVLLDVLDCNETMAKINAIRDHTGQRYLNENNNVAVYIPCDISNENQVQKAIEKAVQHFGEPMIDVLVNNACAFVFRSVEDATVEDWTKSLNVNILGHALVTKHCLPYMKHATDNAKIPKGHGPSIIFQGSISSYRGQPNCATYATTKGAIVQLARNCAYDLAKYNIRCNSICAGAIETPISQEERQEHGWSYEEWEALKTQDVMLGRVGTPLEIAHAAVFLANSHESSYITGISLMVDGGAAACTVMQK